MFVSDGLWCLLYACDALCKQGKVGFGADGFASSKKEVVVVGRNAFKCPKLLGVVFLVEIIRCEEAGLMDLTFHA